MEINNIFDSDVKNLWKSLYYNSNTKDIFKRDKKLYHGCYLGIISQKKEKKPVIRVEFKGSIYLNQFNFSSIDLKINHTDQLRKTLIISPKYRYDYNIFQKYIPYFFYNESKLEITATDLKKILNEMSQIGDLLLEKKKTMTLSNVIGLYGEMVFLNSQLLKNKKQHEKHLEAWQKNEKSNNDFIYSDKEYEVKTTTSESNVVKINSEYQLESHKNNPVFLKLIKIKEQIEGQSLDDLINKIKEIIRKDIKMTFKFNLKLEILGYVSCSNTKNKKFNLIKTHQLKIDKNFPKLSIKTIPRNISDVKYSIDLSNYLNE